MEILQHLVLSFKPACVAFSRLWLGVGDGDAGLAAVIDHRYKNGQENQNDGGNPCHADPDPQGEGFFGCPLSPFFHKRERAAFSVGSAAGAEGLDSQIDRSGIT